jgi:hypothetical protein
LPSPEALAAKIDPTSLASISTFGGGLRDQARYTVDLLRKWKRSGCAAIGVMVDDPGPLQLPFGGTIDIPVELSGALGGAHGLVTAHGFLEQSRLLPRDNQALAFLTIPIFFSGVLGVLTRRWLPVIGSVILLAAISLLMTGSPRLAARARRGGTRRDDPTQPQPHRDRRARRSTRR